MTDDRSARTRYDDVHSVLADPDRRAVLRALAGDDPPGTLPELIDRVGTQRPGITGRGDAGLRVRLHHQHLPMMADAGVVEYDPYDGRVALTPAGRRAREVGELTAEVLGHE